MPRILTSEQIAEFIRLVEVEGKTSEEAAAQINVKPGSIRNTLRESGYRVRTIRKVERIPTVPIAA